MVSALRARSRNLSPARVDSSWSQIGKAGAPLALVVCFLLAALVAGWAPVAVKIAAVGFFAGPHNWLELRFMLSRLPARWQRARSFFFISFAGLAALSLSFIAIMAASYLAPDSLVLSTAYSTWGSALVAWLFCLIFVRQKNANKRTRFIWFVLSALAIFACWQCPEYFSLALVYIHPLVALVILERELSRGRSDLLPVFRLTLVMVPAVLSCFWCQTSLALPNDGAAKLVLQQSGAGLPLPLPAHFLVSTLVFFDLLHYAVWLLAIPLFSLGWRNFRPRAIPWNYRSPVSKRLVSGLFAGSTAVVVLLWLSFARAFDLTYTVYFIVAIVHVLAELPFLIWSQECS